MSKSTKSGAKASDVPYEEALGKLEEIVEAMESGDLPLEKLLTHFEEGTRLARHCESKLAQAELRIEQLEQTEGQEPQLKPFDTTPSQPD